MGWDEMRWDGMGVPLHPPQLGLLVSAQLSLPVQFVPGPQGPQPWLLASGLPHAHGAEQSCPYPHLCHVPWIRNSWNRCTGLWPNSQGGIPKFSDSRPEHIHSCRAVGTGDTPEHPSPEAQLISRMCVKQDLIISPPCPHFPASSKQRGASSSAVQSVSLAQASRAGQGSLLPSA